MEDNEIIVLEALSRVLGAERYQNLDFLSKKRVLDYILSRFSPLKEEKVAKNVPFLGPLEEAKKHLKTHNPLKIGDIPPFGGTPITCNTEQ